MSILSGLTGPSQTIYGTAHDDTVHISRASGLAGLLGFYDVEINGQHRIMSKEALENTRFELGAGDDKLIVAADVDANITANGGAGDDRMIGGAGNDRFDGGAGDDYLSGNDGRDALVGGSGNDTLLGGRGKDHLSGGSDDDYLDGGKGYDWNDPGSGHDTVKFDIVDYRGALKSLPTARAEDIYARAVNPLTKQPGHDEPVAVSVNRLARQG